MSGRKTHVTIEGSKFKINGSFTYPGRAWEGSCIEGQLFNTRMVQGIFDDKNPDTVIKWVFPDTGIWDADRNTKEFITAMPLWKERGVLCFTINMQGGSPEGYSREQPWQNSAFREDGSLDMKYMERLEKILDKADEIGMVVILGYFYFGQAGRLRNEQAVIAAVRNATQWVLDKRYANVLVEISNECDINNIAQSNNFKLYPYSIMTEESGDELIALVKSMEAEGRRLLVSTSFRGNAIPTANILNTADFILIHGNGVGNPYRIKEMVDIIKGMPTYQGQPILFNEDDHFDFDKDINNMAMAVKNGASWGYFDPGMTNYRDGYQCPPVNWGINTKRKKEFFAKVKEITQG